MREAGQGRFITILLWHLSIILGCQTSLFSQTTLCSGNLGDNVFTSGDFGSGNAVVFPSDPGLAPGFIYTLQVPPDDGEYTLTNDMTKWPFAFPTWLLIGDNSPDPKGYMMVINASFTAGIFYSHNDNGGNQRCVVRHSGFEVLACCDAADY